MKILEEIKFLLGIKHLGEMIEEQDRVCLWKHKVDKRLLKDGSYTYEGAICKKCGKEL